MRLIDRVDYDQAVAIIAEENLNAPGAEVLPSALTGRQISGLFQLLHLWTLCGVGVGLDAFVTAG